MEPNQLRDLDFDPQRLERVRETITRDIEAERYDGVALIVGRGDRVALDVLEGFADRSTGRRLGRDATFATMSVGKQFTNVLALSLVERGTLRLHVPVADVLPEFGVLGKEKVNLYHLLTHTSGVASAIPAVPPEVLTSIAELAGLACRQPLESLPGERVNYSILVGHAVIAAMCVRADGGRRTFAQMLDDELFRPLDMRDTCLGSRPDLLERLCPVRAVYRGIGLISPEAVEGVGALLRMPGCEIPAGGFVTTVRDLHRFAEMLRRGGELDGARILAPATIDYCTRNHTGDLRNVLFDPCLSYRGWQPWPAYIGVGFFVRGEQLAPGPFGAFNSPRTFGGAGAGSTAFWVDPQHDLSFAFLSSGLIEDSHHLERLGMISDLIVSALVR